jgi:hypothetical protein
MRRPSAHWLLLIPLTLFGLAYIDRIESGPSGDWRPRAAARGPRARAADTRAVVQSTPPARSLASYFGVPHGLRRNRDHTEFTV